MDEINLIDHAEKNLQRQIEWVGRVETRSALILGITVGMLGYLASVIPHYSLWTCWFIVATVFSFSAKILCLFFLFMAQIPRTQSPKRSLIFFGDISRLNIEQYSDLCKKQNRDDYLDDLYHQTHANSVIIYTKFKFVKRSMISLLASSPPWIISIIGSQLITPLQ